MRDLAIRVAKFVAYPAFYLFCLGIFGYLSFPYGRLKDRIVAEFERKGKPGQRLEIGGLTSYWFTGVELSGVKLTLPPDEPAPGLPRMGEDASAAPAKDTVLTIDEAHARVRILPLLIGRVRIDFAAKAFGGELKGTVPVSSGGDVEITLDHIDIGQIEPLTQAIGGVPIKGLASGKLALTASDGKFNKANGSLDVTVSDVVVSDGKTKIQGLIELPAAKVGDLTLQAEAKEGKLKITKLAATGTDLELVGDGTISVREPWNESTLDLYLRFKFTDAYRGKSSLTKSLLGDPGSTSGGLMELQVPKMKRAKRPDGFYGWHAHGALKRIKFDPTATDGPAAGKRGKTDTGAGGAKRIGGMNFPLGTAAPRDKDKDDSPIAVGTPPSSPTPPARTADPPPPLDRRPGWPTPAQPPAAQPQQPPAPEPAPEPPPANPVEQQPAPEGQVPEQ